MLANAHKYVFLSIAEYACLLRAQYQWLLHRLLSSKNPCSTAQILAIGPNPPVS